MVAYPALSSAVRVEPPAGPAPPGGTLELSRVSAGPTPTQDRETRSALDEDIAGLHLEPVSYLAVLSERWGLDKVDAIELEYRCLLQCVRDFPEQLLAPSLDCDLYWHCHILCLDLYLRQTTGLFGRPLLHWPFSGARGEADAARQRARFLKSRRIVGDLIERVRRARQTNLQQE
jgi:hypothetical protein